MFAITHPIFFAGYRLNAKIIYCTPIIIEYFVALVDTINVNIKNKIHYHFNNLELGNLYTIEATNELHNKKFRLKKLFEEKGKEAVQAYLHDEYISYRNNDKNSWQTALFRVLSEDEKFYNNVLYWLK